MRPATAFATFARKFSSRVQVWNGANKADGKSSLDLILLVAMPGAELTLDVDGSDAATAIDLTSTLTNAFWGYVPIGSSIHVAGSCL